MPHYAGYLSLGYKKRNSRVPFCDPYLKQWFINEHGGNDPVNLVRGSAESNILKLFLKKRPDDVRPELPAPDALAIFAPSFKKQDPRVFNYLPHSAKIALH